MRLHTTTVPQWVNLGHQRSDDLRVVVLLCFQFTPVLNSLAWTVALVDDPHNVSLSA